MPAINDLYIFEKQKFQIKATIRESYGAAIKLLVKLKFIVRFLYARDYSIIALVGSRIKLFQRVHCKCSNIL